MIRCGEERNVRAPKELHQLITAYGGRNPHGDPMYRLVWGWERRELRAAPTTLVTDTSIKNRKFEVGRNIVVQSLPKYPARERFHLEVWCDPTQYGTKEEWAAKTHKLIEGQIVETLGPYPSAGEYEHLWEFSDVDGGYLHPTENIALRAIRQHKHAINMDRIRRHEGLERMHDEQEAARDSYNRTATRELAKEFVERSLPGRTVQQLKEELTAPKKGKRWQRSR